MPPSTSGLRTRRRRIALAPARTAEKRGEPARRLPATSVARGRRPPHNTTVKRAALLALVVATGFAGWTAVARPRWVHLILPPSAPRNLLLISIDTLRADHLGCYGYAGAQTPRVDALARSGLRFERNAGP